MFIPLIYAFKAEPVFPVLLLFPGAVCSPKAVVCPPHLIQRAGSAVCRHGGKKEAFAGSVIPALRLARSNFSTTYARIFGSRQGFSAAPVRTVEFPDVKILDPKKTFMRFHSSINSGRDRAFSVSFIHEFWSFFGSPGTNVSTHQTN